MSATATSITDTSCVRPSGAVLGIAAVANLVLNNLILLVNVLVISILVLVIILGPGVWTS